MIRKYCIIISLILFAFPDLLYGQGPSLEEKLRGLDKLGDIMAVVGSHYDEIKSGQRARAGEPPIKHWVRWAYKMSTRTDGQGRIVDIEPYIKRALDMYPSDARSSAGNWTFLGPSSINNTNGSAIGIGRADRIAFHPSDVNTLYVASPSGGLLKTTNGGLSWTPLTDNLPSTGVSGVVVNYANPNVIMILTGDGDSSLGGFVKRAGYWRSSAGAFISFDAGLNWYPAAPFPDSIPAAGYQLVQDPNNPDVVLAATDLGIFRSTNFGGSWTSVLSGTTFELKFRPGDSNIVYATRQSSFERSTDGGVTWTTITNFDAPIPVDCRVALAVNPGAPNRVYLIASGPDDEEGIFGGYFSSTDAGLSFQRLCITPNIVASGCDGLGGNAQSYYDLAVAADYTDPDRIIVGGVRTWRSDNDGFTWQNVSAGRCGGFTTSTGFVHADVHDLEVNPLNGSIYMCNDGGVIRSDDFGDTWINMSEGFVTSQIYLMSGTPGNLDNMIIGLQDNGLKRRNLNSTVWDHILNGDGFDAAYKVGSTTTGYLSANRQVRSFTNNGANSDTVLSAALADLPDLEGWLPRVQVHNTDPQIVLVGASKIFRSTDNGSTWSTRPVPGNWDIERCPSNPSRFYAAGTEGPFITTGGEMYRSDDSGDTWTMISNNAGFPTEEQRITDIEVNPAGSNNVWITLGGTSAGQKVFTSFDAGNSWTNISGSLPNIPINAIQIDASGNAYIGTDIGVFYRQSGGDWVPFWNSLPRVPVSDLVIYPNDNIIRASTFGRGVWQSNLYSSCDANVVLLTNISGNRYFEASNAIISTSTIFGAANTRVVFKSGEYMEFRQGFQVGAGNKFRAYLSPCGVADEEY